MKSFAAKQHFLLIVLLIILSYTAPLAAQERSTHSNTESVPFPQIRCVLTTPIDSVFFRDSVYVPQQFYVKVCVTNIGTDTAKDVRVSLVSNTRFIITPPSTKVFAAVLLANETVCDSFLVNMTVRTVDGLDTLLAVATTVNGASSVCQKTHWVQHEFKPVLVPNCKVPEYPDWNDAKNDYDPQPFLFNVTVLNSGEDNSDSTKVILILPKGLTSDSGSFPIRELGTLIPNEQRDLTFRIRTVKRNVDSWDTICVQFHGKGGLKNQLGYKTFTVSCCELVFIPAARQPEYECEADILTDSVRFINQQYIPQPFVFRVKVKNNGTANGINPKAQIVLLPSVSLAQGQSPIVDLPKPFFSGRDTTIEWQLIAGSRNTFDTVKICARVSDLYGNQTLCCDSVYIDSVRCGKFAIVYACPDTLRVDPVAGVYIPNPFTLQFNVRNIGSDNIDSIRATLTIEDPDVASLTANPILLPRLDTNRSNLFTWTVKASPRALPSTVRFRFKVETTKGSCTEVATGECLIHIPRLEAPNLKGECATDPIDTVRYDPILGKYYPEKVTFTVRAMNSGGGVAEEDSACLLIPPGFVLENDNPCHPMVPFNITAADTGLTSWQLTPLPRRDAGRLSTICAEITSKNAGTVKVCCDVFVVALPFTAAIAITQDNVGYYTQEILVPVIIDNSNGKDIKKIQFDVTFDPQIVQYLGAEPKGTMLDGWNIVSPANDQGLLRVFATSTGAPLSGAGTLVYLRFLAVFGAPPNQLKVEQRDLKFITTPLPIPYPIFNDGSIFVRTTDGKITISGECIRPLNASDRYIISQNRPNPFNPSTVIEYGVPEQTRVRIMVFDAFGREVETLVNEIKQKGLYQVVFDGSKVPSGIYFYKMETPTYTRVMKMIIAR